MIPIPYKHFLVTIACILLCMVVAAQSHALESNLFKEQTIDDNISIGYGIAISDVDGDKRPDILLADKTQIVWYRNGDWQKFVMAEHLTEMDNVCIAAEDLDGDGKAEVAVGAQWNPSETSDEKKSGAIFFLTSPADLTQLWKATKLYHEPTIHRMRWMKSAEGKNYLLVLPLHGQGNQQGKGKGVNLLVFRYPDLLHNPRPLHIIPTGMHQTHNLDMDEKGIYVAGKEGVGFIDPGFDKQKGAVTIIPGTGPSGEVRIGQSSRNGSFIATIEPIHGSDLVIYMNKGSRLVLDTSFNEGHGLAAADVLGLGYNQVIAGWRQPDKNGEVGIKLYIKKITGGNEWEGRWIDRNGMACEDLQVADLNGDGRMEIIAAGRKTHNLKIYWNTLH
ncbi:MAG TPA: VCBS repeat-containing protein [Niabella sp.]|nr:VCBS repeat-containing protein [Niabella sp.]